MCLQDSLPKGAPAKVQTHACQLSWAPAARYGAASTFHTIPCITAAHLMATVPLHGAVSVALSLSSPAQSSFRMLHSSAPALLAFVPVRSRGGKTKGLDPLVRQGLQYLRHSKAKSFYTDYTTQVSKGLPTPAAARSTRRPL